jgi:gluconolactonase
MGEHGFDGSGHSFGRPASLPLGVLQDTRYPDPRVESLDPRFKARQGNAGIERIATGFRWAEGPVYFPAGGYLLWSDIPNNRIMRWLEDDGHVSVFRADSHYANGNTRDREGRLVTCEHDARRVTRTEADGRITVLMDSNIGKRLNAPNDVVVASDGRAAKAGLPPRSRTRRGDGRRG